MPVAIRKFYSEEDFLALERISKTKNEYYRGEIFAMSGASYQHNQIASTLLRTVGNYLDGKECNIFGSDLRIYSQEMGFYTYPDAVIICGEPNFLDTEFDTVLNPVVIVEILSPSTRTYDQTTKFEFYKKIPSLKQYILIDSQRVHVEVFSRALSSWKSQIYSGAETSVEIKSIGFTGTLQQLYQGVKFPA